MKFYEMHLLLENNLLKTLFSKLTPNVYFNWSSIDYPEESVKKDIEEFLPGVDITVTALKSQDVQDTIEYIISKIAVDNAELADKIFYLLQKHIAFINLFEIFDFLNNVIDKWRYPVQSTLNIHLTLFTEKDINVNLLLFHFSIQEIRKIIFNWYKTLNTYDKLSIYDNHQASLDLIKTYLENMFYHQIIPIIKEITKDEDLINKITSILDNIIKATKLIV